MRAGVTAKVDAWKPGDDPITLVQSRWKLLGAGLSGAVMSLGLLALGIAAMDSVGTLILFGLMGLCPAAPAAYFLLKIRRLNVLKAGPDGLDLIAWAFGRERRFQIAWNDIDHFNAVRFSRFMSMVGFQYAKHYVPKPGLEAGLFPLTGGWGGLGPQWPGSPRATVALLNAAHARWAKVSP